MNTMTYPAKTPDEILIVEDSQTQAEKLIYSLETNGYRIKHAKNGKQAMEYLDEYHPALVISDIVMPQMNGYELCKSIKLSEYTRDIPVILMTSLNGTEEVMESLACGADNFVTKPYSISYLLTQIKDILSNKLLIRNEDNQNRVEISLKNHNRKITVDPQHMLNLLLSTYESAIEKKLELVKTQDELILINENLEDIVKEKTSELVKENEKRKKTEYELLEAQRIAHIGSFEYDVQNSQLKCTTEVLNIFGIMREEFSEEPDSIIQYIHPEDREHVFQIIARATYEKNVDEQNVRIIRPNGEERIVNVCILMAFDAIGNCIRITGTVQDITEQKKANKALAESQESYRHLFEYSGVGIGYYTIDGIVISYNQLALKNMGGQSENFVGKPISAVFPKAEADKYLSRIKKAVSSDQPQEYEDYLLLNDGPKWYSSTFSRVLNLDKEIIGVQIASLDITDRKQAEALQKESEDIAREAQSFLQAAFDNSQAGIAIADAPDGKLRYVNKAGLMIRDQSEEQLVKNIDVHKYTASWNIMHLDGTPYKEDEVPLARAVLYGETCSEEFIIRRDSFEDRIVLANAAPVKDSDNKIKAGIVVFLDITEKKRIDEKLIESELTHKALFDYSGVGISYYTKDGRVISFNEKAAANMGGSRDDFEGKSIFDFFPKDNAELYLDRITICASSYEPQHYEDFVQLPTGDLWFFSTYTRILDAAGNVKGIQIISHDISELKEKEKKISYLSYHDQLTGLYNRRFFDEELIRLDTSRNLPLTIAMGDVNGLKLVNDSFGHKTGDQLLICAANVLKKACRQDDIIARVGGDEFSIIFPKTDEAAAEMIIQRINRLISQEKIGPLEFSIAFSFATKTSDESIGSIIKKAEDHMSRNKLNDSSSLRNATIRLIMNTLFEKNSRELKHSERVSSLCVEIASAMGFEKNEVNRIRSAGLMHDIGKIGIDEHILNSETRLSDDEWKEVKKHSEIGYRILSASPDFSDIAEDVFSHHERWDGTGYPRGINGKSISVYARIITIADAFDAMISERPYRNGDKALRTEDAINEIKKNAGSQFDPLIAKMFVEKVLNVTW